MEDLSKIDELPIGIVQGGQWLRKFVFNDLDGSAMKLIHDRMMRRDKILSWTARVIALCLDSIEGTPVYPEYRANNFKKIPEIVLDLPMLDISYLFIKGHVHNFGNMLKDMNTRCPLCGKSFITDFDLNQLECDKADHPISEIVVNLQQGYVKKTGELGVENIKWDQYTFRPPDLGDAVRNESIYRAGEDIGDFDFRVLSQALIRVSSSEIGGDMSDDHRHQLGDMLIRDLKASDIVLINRDIGKLPTVGNVQNVTCTNCGENVRVAIDPFLLYPRG